MTGAKPAPVIRIEFRLTLEAEGSRRTPGLASAQLGALLALLATRRNTDD